MIHTIKLVGVSAETQSDLLKEFFNGCYQRGHKPVSVEYGWLIVDNDKTKTRRGYNLLVGRYEKKERWENDGEMESNIDDCII